MARVIRSIAAAGGVLVVLALPGTATASSVAMSAGTLIVSASGGESNDFRVSSGVTGTEVTDAAPISAGSGCFSDVLNSRHATCHLASPARVLAVLGDRNDSFVLSQNVPASVDGGSGGDQITTGGGHDTIYARDNEFDSVGCGAGTDTVYADRGDLVGASCDRVNVPPAPVEYVPEPVAADGGGGRIPTSAPRQRRGFLRLPRTPTVDDLVNDRFSFSVRCVVRCDVESKLTADTSTKARMRLRKRVVGRGGGEVGAGRAERLPIRLLAKASGRLRRARKLRLRLTSKIYEDDTSQVVEKDVRTVVFVRARTARKRKR